MTVDDILVKIRRRIRDTEKLEYADEELISYLNDAIILVSQLLVSAKNEEMIVDFVLKVTITPRPINFLKFTASYPVQVQSNDLICYGNLPQPVRYFRKPALANDISDTLPFNYDGYNQILEQITAMIALNRNEFDIGQDKMLFDEIKRLIEIA